MKARKLQDKAKYKADSETTLSESPNTTNVQVVEDLCSISSSYLSQLHNVDPLAISVSDAESTFLQADEITRKSRSKTRSPRPSTSRRLQSYSLRKNRIRTSSPLQTPPLSPQMTPSISSIHSTPSTLCPNSPSSNSSITTVKFDNLKNSFKRYQRKSSSQIMNLQRQILVVVG